MRRFRCSRFSRLDGWWGDFISTCIRAKARDKWFSAAPVVTGVRGRAMPEAALICNFPAAETSDPGLLQYSDVVTFFHEFGHLMHAILGGHTEWAGLSGFATEGDFIEVPSQMLEEFFRDEKLLQAFAKHYETGASTSGRADPEHEARGRFRESGLGEDAALLHDAFTQSARPGSGKYRSRHDDARAVQAIPAVDVA